MIIDKQITLSYRQFPKEFTIDLPYSKSVVARQLLLAYLENKPLPPLPEGEEAYSLCNEDILVIWRAVHHLRRRPEGDTIQIDCGSSATAMRFLMIASIYEHGETFLVGSPQLMSRIAQDDLTFFPQLGAECQLHECGVAIYPQALVRKIHISPQWKSSQYASAIEISNHALGLEVSFHFPSHSPSYSYLELTRSMLHRGVSDVLERDWSAATFWYQLSMSHPEEMIITMPGLFLGSQQPDRFILRDGLMMSCVSEMQGESLILSPMAPSCRTGVDRLNVGQYLDSFLPLALSYIRHRQPFTMLGTKNLRYKESNRIGSFLEAMEWYNVVGFSLTEDSISWDGTWGEPPEMVMINPNGDHRVAMAIAMFAVSLPGVTTVLLDPECVSKSYPRFFDQLLSL